MRYIVNSPPQVQRQIFETFKPPREGEQDELLAVYGHTFDIFDVGDDIQVRSFHPWQSGLFCFDHHLLQEVPCQRAAATVPAAVHAAVRAIWAAVWAVRTAVRPLRAAAVCSGWARPSQCMTVTGACWSIPGSPRLGRLNRRCCFREGSRVGVMEVAARQTA